MTEARAKADARAQAEMKAESAAAEAAAVEAVAEEGGTASDGPQGGDLVGKRIRLWWGGDLRWYAGVVTSYAPTRGHLIRCPCFDSNHAHT